jgi:FG-GAP-like repeat/PASTA domain/FG-GAP repeat
MLRPGMRVTQAAAQRLEGWSSRCGARGCAVLLACGTAALSLSIPALFASASPSFLSPKSYLAGEASNSVAIGDLNGDGRPDLAIANGGENPLSVLLNRGDGRFQARRVYETGSGGSISVAIGDLNGDGKPDLATANTSANTFSVLLNRGDGSFYVTQGDPTGREPVSVAIGDLNGDGKVDLATANRASNTVSVFLSRGDGSFQPKVDYGTGRRPFEVAAGDLNGDRQPDLAVANARANTVSVLLNRGDGSLQTKVDYRTVGAGSVAIGDLNGDGKPEIVTANALPSSVSVLLNRGDGSFRARRDYATGGGPQSVAIGDLNGDGKADLATANINGTVSALANKGNGGFQAKLDYTAGREVWDHELWSVAIGDLNGDRKQDLAAAGYDEDGTGTVSVLLNRPGLCSVQNVHGMSLATAKRTIARANCRVGKIRRVYSKSANRGRVISQRPKPGMVLPGDGKVNLVVSRGRRR